MSFPVPFKLPKTPPGACKQCARAHTPDQPHNPQSLFYQYKFYEEKGRFPDWKDAMSHCEPSVVVQWREALIRAGVDVDGGAVHPKTSFKANL